MLEEAGYVVVKKATVAGRVRTRAALTSVGRRAFQQHVAALQEIVQGQPTP